MYIVWWAECSNSMTEEFDDYYKARNAACAYSMGDSVYALSRVDNSEKEEILGLFFLGLEDGQFRFDGYKEWWQ